MPTATWPSPIVAPPTGVSVRRGDPLAVGLTHLFAFSEASGGIVRNLANPMRSARLSAPSWAASTSGPALRGDGVSTFATVSGPHPTGAVTVFVIAARDENTPTSTSSKVESVLSTRNAVDASYLELNLGNGFGLAGDLNKPRWDPSGGTAVSAWLNGRKQATVNPFADDLATGRLGTLSASATGVVDGNAFWLGAGTLNGPSPFYLKGRIALVAIWARVLTESEHAALHRDPWRLVAPSSFRVAAAVATIQIAYPVADVSDGSWTNESGSNTNLYASLDETTASDGDYIRSSQSPASPDVVKIRLGALTDPAVGTGHTLRVRYLKDTSGGDRIDLTWTLYQADGTTVVASGTLTDIGSVTDLAYTLTTGEANSIPSADYTTGLVLGLAAIKV